MISEYIIFDLPKGITREQAVKDMEAMAPAWRKKPDLDSQSFSVRSGPQPG